MARALAPAKPSSRRARNAASTRWSRFAVDDLLPLIADFRPGFAMTVLIESFDQSIKLRARPPRQDLASAGLCRQIQIGIVLLPEHRGRGVGSRAQQLLADYLFSTTTAHRLEAVTEVDNFAEQRALEPAGFIREGVLRGRGFVRGQRRDGYIYSPLRDDPAPEVVHERKTTDVISVHRLHLTDVTPAPHLPWARPRSRCSPTSCYTLPARFSSTAASASATPSSTSPSHRCTTTSTRPGLTWRDRRRDRNCDHVASALRSLP